MNSCFLPRVFTTYSNEYVVNIFENHFGMGVIHKINSKPVTDTNGIVFNAMIVEFDTKFYSPEFVQFKKDLMRDGSYNLSIDGQHYWKIYMNKFEEEHKRPPIKVYTQGRSDKALWNELTPAEKYRVFRYCIDIYNLTHIRFTEEVRRFALRVMSEAKLTHGYYEENYLKVRYEVN